MTGKMDWELQSEDYDYQQELARAGFADMLHDYDRVTFVVTIKLHFHDESGQLFRFIRISNTLWA